MISIIFFLMIILGIGIWIYLTSQQNNKNQVDNQQIRILCKEGYIIGHYVAGNRFIGQRFIDNKLVSEGIFVNTVQVGNGKEYYENGSLKYEGNFVAGVSSGQGKLYEENGKLKYIGNFKNGYASGQGRIFDANGRLKCEGNFERVPSNQEKTKDLSVPSGLCKEYYENGQLKYDGNFLNGVWHGEGRFYNANGHLIFKGKFWYGKPEKK